MNIDNAIKTLREFYLSQKRLPSYEEMKDLFGFSSKRTGFTWANKLIELGIIEKDHKGKLVPKNLFSIPMLGVIKAGHPMTAESVHEGDALDLYQFLLGMPAGIFSLTVKGDSMIEEGIHEGDIVIIDKTKTPRNGDVVAACVDNEWTVKYFHRDNGSVCLIPANKKYPVIYPKYSLTIGGVVISVIRKYH